MNFEIEKNLNLIKVKINSSNWNWLKRITMD